MSAIRMHSNRPLCFFIFLFLFTVAVPAVAQSDSLVEFFGHIPHTWDDGDPQTENRVFLRGRLIEPAGAGPHPAVVVLHGSTGMWNTAPHEALPLGDMRSQFDDWAAMLVADGYVTLILDSFGPRGYVTFQGKKPPEDADVAPVYERARDAYDALAYLRGLPNVDGERVGLLGFSHGGGGVAGALADADAIEAVMGTSFTVSTVSPPQPGTYAVPSPARPEPAQSGFDCGVAYYPGAAFFSYFGSGSDPNDGYYRPSAPLRMIYGDQDGFWTTGHPSVLEQKAQFAGSSDLVLSVYPGADHSFDTSGTQEADDARAETRALFAECLAGAAVSGHVWADLDADGHEGGSEPPLEGVLVELTDGIDTWQSTSVADGSYRFDSLPAGNYELHVDLPTDYAAITVGASVIDAQGDSLPFVLVEGQTLEAQHAPLWPAGTDGQIAGFVWEDADEDGLFENAEVGLEGLDVHLETPAGTLLASTVSAVDGAYDFAGLLPGSYRLRVMADGWRATAPGLDSVLIGDLFSADLVVAADASVAADAGLVTVCEALPLVAYGSSWAYELTTDPPAGWMDGNYDDAGWSRAHGLLGHSSSQVYTALGTSSRVTRYFRHSFDVAEPDLVAELFLELERDDGAIVYLNGVEVLRSNLPDVVDASTRAIVSSWDVDSTPVDPSLLVAGSNVIAVELHQKWISDGPDWAFDLELRSTLCEPCAVRAVELEATADTHLRESSPATVHGGWSSLWVAGGNSRRAALMHFELPSLPLGSSVLGADLLLEVTSDTTAYYPLHAAASDWQQSAASWQVASDQDVWASGDFSPSDLETEVLGVAHRETGNGSYALGFTAAGIAQLEDWLAGSPNLGLVIAPGDSSSSDNLAASSREGATPPRLRLVYRDGSCQF